MLEIIRLDQSRYLARPTSSRQIFLPSQKRALKGSLARVFRACAVKGYCRQCFAALSAAAALKCLDTEARSATEHHQQESCTFFKSDAFRRLAYLHVEALGSPQIRIFLIAWSVASLFSV